MSGITTCARGVGRLACVGVATFALAVASTTVGPSAHAEDAPVSFTATDDTYVDAATPTSSYGSSSRVVVDASPYRQAFLRFDLSTLQGRTITSATLRLYSADAATLGGRVHTTSQPWSEATTWDTRPALDGTPLASIGAVNAGTWYDIALPVSAVSAGVVSLGMDSTSGNGARYGTSESTTKPLLVVTVASDATPAPPPADPEPEPPASVLDGLSTVAGAAVGSSDATYFSGQHRLATTRGGRVLAVFGRHRSGVQLAWRDPTSTWQTTSTGASTAGGVLTGTGTGDWPASLAVTTDSSGEESAWVVWSGASAGDGRPVQMRRLTALDSPSGPHLGPVVTIDARTGAYRADIAFEPAASGSRGVIVYSRPASASMYELVTAGFDDLTSDSPPIQPGAVLASWPNKHHYGSLVATPAGMRVVAKTGAKSPRLQLYVHDPANALTTWRTAAAGPVAPYGSAPNGSALPTGEIVVVFEDDLTNHVSHVYRFNADGSGGSTLLRGPGLAQPAVTTNGSDITLVAVRSSDGAVVSRTSSGGSWGVSDRLEVSPVDTGPLAWPNVLRQADGRLRLIADGPGSSASTSSVWAFQRAL